MEGNILSEKNIYSLSKRDEANGREGELNLWRK
jgi:hypothetical protein